MGDSDGDAGVESKSNDRPLRPTPGPSATRPRPHLLPPRPPGGTPCSRGSQSTPTRAGYKHQRGRLGSEDQKGWCALTLVGDLVGNSQHQPALGPTRLELSLVTRLLTHPRSSPLCSSVPLCFRPHPSSALRRVW
jgi:hypothetical protein